jgi:hypothetical protein
MGHAPCASIQNHLLHDVEGSTVGAHINEEKFGWVGGISSSSGSEDHTSDVVELNSHNGFTCVQRVRGHYPSGGIQGSGRGNIQTNDLLVSTGKPDNVVDLVIGRVTSLNGGQAGVGGCRGRVISGVEYRDERLAVFLN